ncbi:uncharacterized protein BJ171DRAFT_453694 [Polychytrium aggregatum]|uniref:uncharacterized protein n=1 Tax=Polychytrium aggregatum TaxID=110093 RepID=UPI0022FE758C|nr:uncharacterized protein BJ171DRAFT_453694 [Polychytrium aggregatum]KAI9209542.1 hypothetical protein BJ171DRAFT_453694 [Polychytrium aggregatum]
MDGTLNELQKQLPFLPGHTFDLNRNIDNKRKSHAFDYCNGVPVFREEAPGIGGELLRGQNESKLKTSAEMYPHANNMGESVPAWVAFDRKVLRFYAYFQEAVHEKREEQYRVRKVNIYFYLEDDTVHVSEPKTPNSGIPQGTLIRRHRIPKADSPKGQHYTINDFNVDREVTFYARTFKIVGCDQFTRDFLVALDIAVPKNGEFPKDQYELYRNELLSRMKATRPCPPKTSLKKFLENDRRVLRFYCVWDDTNSVFGDVRHMIVHYYLSDDTIEIIESIPANSGRESNTQFLGRCRLPKRPHVRVNHYVNGGGAELENPEGYYKDSDLSIGSVLHFYGRPFVICDCDGFTRQYYAEKYGLENFDPIRIEDYEEPDPAAALSREVAASFVNRAPVAQLLPDEAPKKDFKQMMMYDGVCLRFSAVLETEKQIDKDRKFVISFYLADDTIAVFEPHQRNSGIIGGKFLEKGKIRKPDGTTYYGTSDFYVGARLVFHRHPFVITNADEYTVKYMSAHPEYFPQAAREIAA